MTRPKQTTFGFTAPPVKGFAPSSPDRADRNEKIVADLRSVDALFGRTTYGAGPGMTRYSSYPGNGVTPEMIWNLQLLRNNGYPQLWVELSETNLERDGHLGGISETRRLSVADKDFRFHPARRGDRVADFVQKCVERCLDKMDAFDETIEQLLSAPAYGWGAGENVWAWDKIRVPIGEKQSVTIPVKVIRQVDWVHHKHFRFDRHTDEPYIWLSSGGEFTLPPHKFVFHKASGSGLIEKRGYMGACNWLAAAKRWSERDWLIYGKMFGIPQIIAQFPEGTEEYEKHRAKYVQFLKDWGEGIPALLPDDLKFNISREATGGSANGVHGSIVGWSNQEMSKRVQGSTLTTEPGASGSWALGDVHRDPPYMRARADSKKLNGTFRSDLWRPIVEQNALAFARALGVHPDDITDAVPRSSFRIERETSPRDRQAIYEGAVNELGLPVDEDQYREEFGLDEPRADGRKLRGRLEPIPSGGALLPTIAAAGSDEPTSAAGTGELPPGTKKDEPEPQLGLPPGPGGAAPTEAAGGARVSRPKISRDTRALMERFVEQLPSHHRFEMRRVLESIP